MKRGMFGRVPSTSGSAGMAAHIAQAIAQARNIVCRPVTLPCRPVAPERNKGLTPRDVTPGSGRNVWWQCEKGHEWKASVSNRSRRGHNCPYCADRSKRLGSVAEARPDLLGEWNYGKNTKTPQDCSARSNKKVWWKCSVCGHAWQASPDNRFCGSGCPVCAKKRRGSEGRLGGSPIPL